MSIATKCICPAHMGFCDLSKDWCMMRVNLPVSPAIQVEKTEPLPLAFPFSPLHTPDKSPKAEAGENHEVPEEKQKRVWPLGAHAPGNYTCHCANCKKSFKGDKRAVQCLECAIAYVQEVIEALYLALGEKNEMLTSKDSEISRLKETLHDKQAEAAEYRSWLEDSGELFESKDYLAMADDIRGVLDKYPSTPTPEGESPMENTIIRNLRDDRNKYWEAFEGRISEISTLKKELADLRIQLEDKNAEIELLRKNGASLRPGIPVLDVIKWAAQNLVYRFGAYWGKKYSSVAYTDERIVEEFFKDHPGVTSSAKLEEDKKMVNGVALLVWAEKNGLRRTTLGAWEVSVDGKRVQCHNATDVYKLFADDEAEKNKNHQI